MSAFDRSLISRSIAVIIITVCGLSLCFANDEDYEPCFDKSDPISEEAAKCYIVLKLERLYESRMQNYLEKVSEMNTNQIYSLIRRMNKRRAECKVDALVKFAATWTDIPLDLLLRMEANLTVSDEEMRWLNDHVFDRSLGRPTPGGAVRHCEDEYFGTIGWKRPGPG